MTEQADTPPKPQTHTELTKRGRRVVATSIAVGVVGGGIISQTTAGSSSPGPLKDNETAARQQIESHYQIGQVVNGNKVYDVRVVNEFDADGNLVEPTVFVFLGDGTVREVPFDDPRLSPINREKVRGQLYVEPGNYESGRITNPNFEANLVNFLGLSEDLRKDLGLIKVGANETPRALYFVPSGQLFTENDRQFPVGYKIYNVQPPSGSVSSSV